MGRGSGRTGGGRCCRGSGGEEENGEESLEAERSIETLEVGNIKLTRRRRERSIELKLIDPNSS